MTLFLTTPNQRLEISDAYVMALSFLIFFGVGKIVKAVVKKLERRNAENISIANPRGGSIGIEVSDDMERN